MRLSATLICVAALGLATLPAQADPFRPSIKDQIALGKKVREQVAKEEVVLAASDPRVQELRRIGQAIVAKIPEKDRERRRFDYTFDVIDSPELNAFAAPGGPIYMYTGLLDRMTSEDEVAGILAHEIIHVQNMHWANAYAQQQKRSLGITAVLLILNAGNLAYDLAGMADAFFVGLPYSRRHETEADIQGYDLALRTGYNPKGMVDVFKVLMSESKGKVDERLSTHPDTERRIKAIESRLVKDAGRLPATRQRDPRAVELKTTPRPEKGKKKDG